MKIMSRLILMVCALGSIFVLARTEFVCGQTRRPAESAAATFIQGKAITQEEVSAAAAQELERVEIQHLQAEAAYTVQKHAALETALARIIEDKVLEAEASRRGISTKTLLDQELAGKVKEPTIEDLNAHYPIGKQPAEDVRAKIFDRYKQYLKTENYNKAKAQFVVQLRRKYGVTVSMKPLRLDVKTADRPSSGPAGAPVTVVEFSDFQCAACGAFEATLRGALQKYGQQVRLVFRNFVMPQDVKAEKAAEAALCASDQGRFWEMHKLLFQANRLEERDLMAAAAFLDLDLESFAACLGSGRHAAKVKQDLYDAAAVGVTSAPVFFINGRMLVSPRNVGDITKLVEEELQSSWSPAAPRPRPAKNPF